MTVLSYVSQKEMHEQTGFRNALGYSLPKEDKILIKKGLSKEKKKEVIEHEEEHILKGEEGPFLNFLIPAAASLIGAGLSSRSAGRATDAQTAASNAEIDFARESRDLARSDQAPYREAGNTALEALMSMTGLAAPRSTSTRGPRPGPTGRDGAVGRRFSPGNYLRGLRGRAVGGPMDERMMYNINEMGPENVYEGGSFTRTPGPRTISVNGSGYVSPNESMGGADGGYNLSGRALGGEMRPRVIQDGQVPWRGLPPGRATNGPRPGPLPGGNHPVTVDGRTGEPVENSGGVAGGFNFMTDPGYGFRRDEGTRVIERGAAARGGLLSGGLARRLTRYGQDYASNEYTNVYNRIANIAGLGQVSATNSGNAALSVSGQVGNALSNAGAARASGYTAQGNAWGNAINDIASLPWEEWGNRQPGHWEPI